jgi:hypothetical protein
MPFLTKLVLFAYLAGACACRSSAPVERNPPAPGFDVAGSDPRAIAIADEVMDQLGGRAAWDATRCIEWNFFGSRKHLWDKWTGDYRLDDGARVILMNLQSSQGRVFEKGVEIRDHEQRRTQLERATSIWINDAYWMFMPYKLKDSGVTLRLGGEQALSDGRAADVLVLTFTGVGDTPDNKYEVLVSRDKRWVEEWRFFKRAEDTAPAMATPWTGWRRYGSILLADGRGEKNGMSEINVYDTPPERLTRP